MPKKPTFMLIICQKRKRGIRTFICKQYLINVALLLKQILFTINILYLITMIAMPNLLPAEHRNALSLAITRGNTAQVKYLVETYALDANAFLDDSPTCMPVLMDALL